MKLRTLSLLLLLVSLVLIAHTMPVSAADADEPQIADEIVYDVHIYLALVMIPESTPDPIVIESDPIGEGVCPQPINLCGDKVDETSLIQVGSCVHEESDQ